MIKIDKINKKIGKKLMAFTLVISTSFSGAIRIKAEEGDMCYEEQIIAEYHTIEGDYIVKKKYDNSIEIIESNPRNTNRLILSNDGEVKIATHNSKYLGLFTDIDTTTFKINNFNSQRLDIENIKTSNKDLKKIIKSLENYINSNTLTNINYVELLGEDLMDGMCYNNGAYIKEVSKKQYDDVELNYYGELNKAGVLLASPLILETSGMVIGGTLETGGIVAAVSSPAVILAILLIAGLYAADVYIDNGSILTLDDIDDYTYDIGGIDVSDRTTWMTIAEAMDTVRSNYMDDNPNNDYYQAVLKNNDVYINFITPLSIDQAADLLKVPDVMAAINNNIYTYQPEDAKNVINYAGGIAGTSNGINGKPECHAFWRGYNNFDSGLNTWIVNSNAKPGIYYWHYHFLNKRLAVNGQSQKNIKHVFFGIPIIVTNTDITKAQNNRMYAPDMGNYNSIINDYNNAKRLVK